LQKTLAGTITCKMPPLSSR